MRQVVTGHTTSTSIDCSILSFTNSIQQKKSKKLHDENDFCCRFFIPCRRNSIDCRSCFRFCIDIRFRCSLFFLNKHPHGVSPLMLDNMDLETLATTTVNQNSFLLKAYSRYLDLLCTAGERQKSENAEPVKIKRAGTILFLAALSTMKSGYRLLQPVQLA